MEFRECNQGLKLEWRIERQWIRSKGLGNMGLGETEIGVPVQCCTECNKPQSHLTGGWDIFMIFQHFPFVLNIGSHSEQQ